MWAVRRASTHFRNQGLTSRTCRIFCGKTEIARCCSENWSAGLIEPQEELFDGLLACTRSYRTSSTFLKLHGEVYSFSSQAGATSAGDDDDDNLEDGFSELETPQNTAPGAASEAENDDYLFEEEGASDDILNETETDFGEEKTPSGASSTMAKAILAAPGSSASKVLDKWVEEGNEVTQMEVSLAMSGLRRRRLYVKALQLSEWLESRKLLEFDVKSYAGRVDLIAKVSGPYKAENYIEKIPEAFRTETVYSTLFANYVSTGNIKKSEELFNKMKDLGFPITCFSCNQLLRLYKKNLKKKIGDVLQMMKKENIKPSLLTYQILIDVKGQDNDISGMEKIVETMKADEFEPNTQIQASMAGYYAANGLKEKAEAVLKEMEGGDIKNNRWIYQKLIPIYASLGKDDEVDRIWKVCESDPRFEECTAVIEAFGQLNKIENAEVVFDKFLKNMKKPSSKLFTSLLKVYMDHKMLAKGKDLTKQMAESGCRLGPVTWDALVKLCVAAGEVEEAVSVLGKAVKQKRGRPFFCSFIAIMEEYADRGDVHSAEKIFLMMKQAGYTSRFGPYKSLIRAYKNAKAPAYGFRDRMKADNVFPNQAMAGQLARLEGFKRSAVDDLL